LSQSEDGIRDDLLTGVQTCALPISLLERSRSPAMTKALLQVIGRQGFATDRGAVRALAAHSDPEIRVEAVRALGTLAPDAESVGSGERRVGAGVQGAGWAGVGRC